MSTYCNHSERFNAICVVNDDHDDQRTNLRNSFESHEENIFSKKILIWNYAFQLQTTGSTGSTTAEVAPTRQFAPSSANTASATGRNVEDIGRLASLRWWNFAPVRQPIGSSQPAINGDELVCDGSAKGCSSEPSHAFLAG